MYKSYISSVHVYYFFCRVAMVCYSLLQQRVETSVFYALPAYALMMIFAVRVLPPPLMEVLYVSADANQTTDGALGPRSSAKICLLTNLFLFYTESITIVCLPIVHTNQKLFLSNITAHVCNDCCCFFIVEKLHYIFIFVD